VLMRGPSKATADLSTPLRSAQDDNPYRARDHISKGWRCQGAELSGVPQSWYAACAEKTDLREEC